MSQRVVRGKRGRKGMGERSANGDRPARGGRGGRAHDPARKALSQARESNFVASVVNTFAGAILGLPSMFGVLQAANPNAKFLFPGAMPLAFIGATVGIILIVTGLMGFGQNKQRKPPSKGGLTVALITAACMALLGAAMCLVLWSPAVAKVLGLFERVSLSMAITGVPAAASFLSYRALGAAKRLPPEAYAPAEN